MNDLENNYFIIIEILCSFGNSPDITETVLVYSIWLSMKLREPFQKLWSTYISSNLTIFQYVLSYYCIHS